MKTSTKAERIFRLVTRLQAMGFSYEEVTKLLRIEGTLHRWAEHECNGNIQRDGDNGDGTPRWYYDNVETFLPAWRSQRRRQSVPIPDREAGALKRLAAIMAGHSKAIAYHQSDPRGCALYIVSKADLNGSEINQVYTRGVAVCD